jgi:hypothetical protein
MKDYVRIALVAVVVLLLVPAVSTADIYRWVDDSGTIHFTDDMTNVPAAYRGTATVVVHEAPAPAIQAPESRPEQSPDPSGTMSQPAGSKESEISSPVVTRDEESSQVDQLKAKVLAKEKFVKYVEDRLNLALNPLRSRVVDPGDLELYKKYQAELPQDRELLRELELRSK